MDTTALENDIENLEPEDAMSVLSSALKKLLPVLDEETRVEFVMNLFGREGDDKVGSMVHL